MKKTISIIMVLFVVLISASAMADTYYIAEVPCDGEYDLKKTTFDENGNLIETCYDVGLVEGLLPVKPGFHSFWDIEFLGLDVGNSDPVDITPAGGDTEYDLSWVSECEEVLPGVVFCPEIEQEDVSLELLKFFVEVQED